ncbi:hypothetical protein TNIN_375151 [Trichonephila inaurata madagascariensis]|uniref:Uncharacterized protein n=1 Tax=Trichonephila inaurata madagascariensis TaxID=2747483 RepID=A0A8X6Y0T8_9ARAC|nr:hypothetical protein TNIN_375151 [Trichonephila inaurata madagascariensis]
MNSTPKFQRWKKKPKGDVTFKEASPSIHMSGQQRRGFLSELQHNVTQSAKCPSKSDHEASIFEKGSLTPLLQTRQFKLNNSFEDSKIAVLTASESSAQIPLKINALTGAKSSIVIPLKIPVLTIAESSGRIPLKITFLTIAEFLVQSPLKITVLNTL